MKRAVFIMLVAALVIWPMVRQATAGSGSEVIVMFRTGIPSDLNSSLSAEGASLVRLDERLDFIVARAAPATSFIASMRARSDVEHAYVSQELELSGSGSFCTFVPSGGPSCGPDGQPSGLPPTTGSPNDPIYNQACGTLSCQWAPRLVQADIAWETTMGETSVTVAVVDTGVDATHADLVGNLRDVGPYKGINVVDPGFPPNDISGHGTVVAGVTGATANNGIGIAGIAQSSILAIKACSPTGCRPEHAAIGLAEAVALDSDVIVMSWGSVYDPLLHRAINFSYDAGLLLVAAAGNGGREGVSFPASDPRVIAVSAIRHDGTFSPRSNWGTPIDISAPGGSATDDERDVTVIVPGGYGRAWGTSISAPHVAGGAALLKSANPTWNSTQIASRLLETATPVGVSPNPYHGFGILDLGAALTSGG